MTARDRADELAARRDLWPVVSAYVGRAIDDAEVVVADQVIWLSDEELEAKFRRGEAEHDRGWLRMSRETLEAEVRAEVLDLVLYLAMIRARWPEPSAPAFVSNRDLGDEA